MSHCSDFGFRITSDGLNLLATLKLTAVASKDKEITRRPVLSNDAIKILKLHQEEEQAPPADTTTSRQDSYMDEKGHRRMYSLSDTNQTMLDQLVVESNTRLVAHCEQATDLPTDSLQGFQQCSMDDISAINWQIHEAEAVEESSAAWSARKSRRNDRRGEETDRRRSFSVESTGALSSAELVIEAYKVMEQK